MRVVWEGGGTDVDADGGVFCIFSDGGCVAQAIKVWEDGETDVDV
jgi:hypothetical protein